MQNVLFGEPGASGTLEQCPVADQHEARLGRRTYDATDDVLRNRCVAQLRESRADEETEIWMRRLRDEAFVEYRL